MLKEIKLLACASLIGCCAGAAVADTQIDPDNQLLQYSGRMDFSNPKKPRFDWPHVSVTAVFEGKKCGVKLKGGADDYNVFVDGKFWQIISTKEGSVTYDINGLSDGKHTLLLTKRTSSCFGVGAFEGLVLNDGAKLLPPPAPLSRRIEIVGDSFSVGYGDEGPAVCENLRPYENSYLSYGPVAGRALNAEVRIAAVSGTGMVRNWAAPQETSDSPMPVYYGRTLANDINSSWDFSRWIPQVVVINLGNNDYSTKPQASPETYVSRYHEFIARVRANYPGVAVFCMGQPPFSKYVQQVVKEENGKGFDKVYFVKYMHEGDVDGYGCALHPNVKTQQKFADILSAAIREKMGW